MRKQKAVTLQAGKTNNKVGKNVCPIESHGWQRRDGTVSPMKSFANVTLTDPSVIFIPQSKG
jgi:hypothetical protein